MRNLKNTKISRKKKIKPTTKIRSPIAKRAIFISIALIIIFGFAVYVNSLKGEFLWDDRYLVEENTFIKNFSYTNIKEIFTNHIGKGAGRSFSSYRPIQILTYMVDYYLWKLNPFGYHLTNTVLHVLASMLLFWLIYLLFEDLLLSFLTTCLFAIHPIHTGAVAYISGRADPLSLAFMMFSLIFYAKFVTKGGFTAFAIMAIGSLSAIFSRENALILPGLFLVAGLSAAFKTPCVGKRQRMRLGIILMVVISLSYIILRAAVFHFALPHTAHTSTVLQRMPGFFVSIANYLRLLILPFGLHMEYGNDLYQFSDPQTIFGILVSAALSILALAKRKRYPLSFFCILWFFVALLPVSNLYPIDNYMAEHWLYTPSIGFFLLLSSGLVYLFRKRKNHLIPAILITGIIIFYSYLTIKQTTYWKEPVTFYAWTLRHSPKSVRALNNLANAYDKQGRKIEAIKLYEEAIKLSPRFTTTYFNCGNIYKGMGENKKAIELYEKAVELNPGFFEAYNNLGTTYYIIRDYENAINAYQKAIALDPNFAAVYYNLAVVLRDVGRQEEAQDAYKKALNLNKPK